MINSHWIYDRVYELFSQAAAKRKHTLLPLKYTLELTHRCPLKCSFCYLGKNRIKQELSTIEWLDLISQIPFYGFVTFSGGEPLMREDFFDILNAACQKTFKKVHLETNGILLDDKNIDGLIDAKIPLLSVSLDGWEENHDKLRHHKGAFKRIITNLDNLSCNCKAQKTNITVNIKTHLLKDNLEDILKLYEYSTNKGFDYFSIAFLKNNKLQHSGLLKDTFGKEFYSEKYPPKAYFDLEKFEEIYLEIEKIKKYSKTKIIFSPDFASHDEKNTLENIKKFYGEQNELEPKEIFAPCFYPLSNITINPMGDIYPCLSYRMGNVKEQKLKEVMNSDRYKNFRRQLKTLKLFGACSMCGELKIKEQ